MQTLLRDHLGKLHYFNTIAALGSLRQAADHLHVTQPSLTHAVHVLEEAVGSKLFNRSAKGVAITSAGKLLLTFSQKCFAELNALEGRLRFPTAEVAGIVTIGTYESLAVRLWPKFIKGFAKKYPFVQVSLISESYRPLQQKLSDGRLQLIVTTLVEQHPDIYCDELYNDSFGFFCSPSLKIEKKLSPLKLAEHLKKLPLLKVPLTDSYGFALDPFLWKQGLHESLIYELDTFEAAREFAVEGVGVAILPRIIAREAVAKKRICEIQLTGVSREFGPHKLGVFVRKEQSEDPLIKILLHELKSGFVAAQRMK